MITKSDQYNFITRKPTDARTMKIVGGVPTPYASLAECRSIVVKTVTAEGQLKRAEGVPMLVMTNGIPTWWEYVGGVEDSNLQRSAISMGLGNVDNTSDINKPVSNPQQTVFNTMQAAIDGLNSGALEPTTLTDGPTITMDGSQFGMGLLPSLGGNNTFVISNPKDRTYVLVVGYGGTFTPVLPGPFVNTFAYQTERVVDIFFCTHFQGTWNVMGFNLAGWDFGDEAPAPGETITIASLAFPELNAMEAVASTNNYIATAGNGGWDHYGRASLVRQAGTSALIGFQRKNTSTANVGVYFRNNDTFGSFGGGNAFNMLYFYEGQLYKINGGTDPVAITGVTINDNDYVFIHIDHVAGTTKGYKSATPADKATWGASIADFTYTANQLRALCMAVSQGHIVTNPIHNGLA